MTVDEQKVRIRKAIGLIAAGLQEKELLHSRQPLKYPYSKILQHGINMFLAASWEIGLADDSVFSYADESTFLQQFAVRPIESWFSFWNPDKVQELDLQEESYYAYDAFACQTAKNNYYCTEECHEYLSTLESNILEGTDENELYEKMCQLDQEHYVNIRRFLIEHPIIEKTERNRFLREIADEKPAIDAFRFAYEEFTEKGWRCPACGWTMTQTAGGDLRCHSRNCLVPRPDLSQAEGMDGTQTELFRLKQGIMRYFAMPGKLELQIADYCKKQKIHHTLWPQMDRYDIEIQFSESEVWEIDAKAYRHAKGLRAKLESENGFPEGDYRRGFIVVPTEYAQKEREYTNVVNKVFQQHHQKNVKCVTLYQMKQYIRKKVNQLDEG